MESEGDRGSRASPPRNTDFFIDTILRPDFGCRSARAADTGARAGVTAPDPSDRSDKRGSASKSLSEKSPGKDAREMMWPAWVYCTRYSDRPSSGPRTRRLRKKASESALKRSRSAFTTEQLHRLKAEFQASRYVTEARRRALAHELRLNEAQIKIWFQNKRAKIKKANGFRDGLAVQLMAQGLYNHSTTTVQEEEEEE